MEKRQLDQAKAYRKFFKNPIPYEEIDPKCKDMVKFFNDVGLYTEFSCQGHDDVCNNSTDYVC